MFRLRKARLAVAIAYSRHDALEHGCATDFDEVISRKLCASFAESFVASSGCSPNMRMCMYVGGLKEPHVTSATRTPDSIMLICNDCSVVSLWYWLVSK